MNAQETISLLRSQLGLSARQLSLMLKFSECYIWMVQTGKRQPNVSLCKRLIKLCEVQLGKRLTLDELLGD